MGPAQIVPWIIWGKELIKQFLKGDLAPDFLTEETLLLFRRFKAAFDAKDAVGLAEEISDQYQGTFCGRGFKAELVSFFAEVFRGIVVGVYPELSITIYHVIQKDPGVFKVILEFHSRLFVLWWLPTWSFSSRRVVCEARPEGRHRIWRLTQLDQYEPKEV
jgi:hypothetical protein